MIFFEEVVVFVEEVGAIEEAVMVTQGDLNFVQNPSPRGTHYDAIGHGSFTVWDLTFEYSPGRMICNGEEIDLSKSGLIVRRDGTVLSSYVLPLLAK